MTKTIVISRMNLSSESINAQKQVTELNIGESVVIENMKYTKIAQDACEVVEMVKGEKVISRMDAPVKTEIEKLFIGESTVIDGIKYTRNWSDCVAYETV